MSAADRTCVLEAALKSAAESTVIAIDRIQILLPVVEAARAWRTAREAYLVAPGPAAAEHRALTMTTRALLEFVLAYEQVVASRS